jgi:hypothetical protein
MKLFESILPQVQQIEEICQQNADLHVRSTSEAIPERETDNLDDILFDDDQEVAVTSQPLASSASPPAQRQATAAVTSPLPMPQSTPPPPMSPSSPLPPLPKKPASRIPDSDEEDDEDEIAAGDLVMSSSPPIVSAEWVRQLIFELLLLLFILSLSFFISQTHQFLDLSEPSEDENLPVTKEEPKDLASMLQQMMEEENKKLDEQWKKKQEERKQQSMAFNFPPILFFLQFLLLLILQTAELKEERNQEKKERLQQVDWQNQLKFGSTLYEHLVKTVRASLIPAMLEDLNGGNRENGGREKKRNDELNNCRHHFLHITVPIAPVEDSFDSRLGHVDFGIGNMTIESAQIPPEQFSITFVDGMVKFVWYVIRFSLSLSLSLSLYLSIFLISVSPHHHQPGLVFLLHFLNSIGHSRRKPFHV